MLHFERYVGTVAAQIVFENAVVVVGVVCEQHRTLGIVHKLPQGFIVGDERVVFAFLYYRVHDVAKHRRYFARSRQIRHERGIRHHPALAHLHGSYLYYIVGKHIESGGLRIEHHNIPFFIAFHKIPQIRAAVDAQQIRRNQGTIEQFAHESACRSTALKHTKSVQKACPRHEVHFVVEHRQVCKDELDIRSREQVGA